MNEVIWIQKTAWITWKTCPGLFKYLFIDSNPPSDGIQLQFGRMFHAYAADFFDCFSDDEMLSCKTAAETSKLFEKVTMDQPVVKRWCENFKLFEVGRWIRCLEMFPEDPVKYWRPIATELELWVESTGQLLHIDRVNWYDRTTLINIDYKTGKSLDPKMLRPELTFYNIGLNQKAKYRDIEGKKVLYTIPAPALWIGAYNPTLNITMLERVNQRTTTAVMKSVYRMKTDIRNKYYPYKPSGLCTWCPRLTGCLIEGIIPDGEEPECPLVQGADAA